MCTICTIYTTPPHHTYQTSLYRMYNIYKTYNDFPATKNTTLLSYYTIHLYIYILRCMIDYICAHEYNALACRSLGCHFLDHRMLFNSILFHVNQLSLLTNALIYICSFDNFLKYTIHGRNNLKLH